LMSMLYLTCCCHLSDCEKAKYGRDNAAHARKDILMLMCDWFIAGEMPAEI